MAVSLHARIATLENWKPMLKPIALLLLAMIAGAGCAEATQPVAPSLKPERIYASRIVSTQDAAILHQAFRAASEEDWRAVRQFQDLSRGAIVSDLILWRRATSAAPDLSFTELADAHKRLAAWPNATRIQAAAEAALLTSGLPASAQIEWLKENGPITGAGQVALAMALRRAGDREEAAESARRAWRGRTLDQDVQQIVLDVFAGDLSQADHEARVDFLLWTRQRTSARDLRGLLSSGWRAVLEARIRLQAGQRGVDAAIRAVPPDLQSQAGLVFDRAQWRRRRGMQAGATELLLQITGEDVPIAGRQRLWDERSLAVRRELKAGDFDTAYSLAAPHGLSTGRDFAEAEWLAGWVALRHTGQPGAAQDHFQTLKEGVSTPISVSRANYWLGRSLEANGAGGEALAAYSSAADHVYTYYGQLAAERVDRSEIEFRAVSEPTPQERAAFEGRPLVQAIQLLAEAGQAGFVRSFAYHLDDQLDTPAEFLLLKELGTTYQYVDIGVRGAKAGLARGVVAAEAAYPLVEYPLLRQPRVERSLMLALSRQESEMNPRAISHANARGLMQFLPSTAALEARQTGLPYRTSWLTDDPGYNMTLGGAHLDRLIARFNGSYIMAAAAYNAGARRPLGWIEDYGDPRRGEIDPVDWVEFIPFSETRNYVQRVLENTQVYRHRLSGEREAIRLSEDLDRGAFD